MALPVLVLNLGRESYTETWDLQHQLVKARQAGRIDDVLLLVEHPPVITLGRAANAAHILAASEELAEAGVEVHRVERGGDVTYHGPGQLVGYPILSLGTYHIGPSDYMHALEEVLIRTLRDFGVPGNRRDGIIGVWAQGGKIAALGARIERGVTYHGFALNVAPNLAHFGLIIPCGLTDTPVTSMERELNRRVPMQLVRERLVQHFGEVFGVMVEETTLEQLPL
jgi:lipoate-protein ligase B